jgi:hypothetical protein
VNIDFLVFLAVLVVIEMPDFDYNRKVPQVKSQEALYELTCTLEINLIPNPSPFWRREFKALSRKERVG